MRPEYFNDCSRRIDDARKAGQISEHQAKTLYKDLQGKEEQKQKLDQDFAAKKIEPKLYNEWDANIRTDVAYIKSRVDDYIEDGIRRKKRKVRLKIVGFLVLIMAVWAVFAIPQHIHANRSVANIPEPVQTDMSVLIEQAEGRGETFETKKTISGDGYEVDMTFLAHYDIKGLVVELDDYDHINASAFDKAIPRDISLAWGKVAENKSRFNWSHGGRKLSVGYDEKTIKELGLSRNSVMAHVSNNHLLVDRKDLYQKIKRVRIGDYIEMKGYLISGKIKDGSGNEVRDVKSSLIRTDYSSSVLDRRTSCEIMFVTDLQWLD